VLVVVGLIVLPSLSTVIIFVLVIVEVDTTFVVLVVVTVCKVMTSAGV